MQSLDELRAHLREQIGFLKSSADAFDRGELPEAKRLAVALRILIHESPTSHSLLGQLGQRDRDFCSLSYGANRQGNLLPGSNLLVMVKSLLTPTEPLRYMAPLDDAPLGSVPLSEWWEAPVFWHPDGLTLSRRQLVLSVANKDGGAHVDPELGQAYAHFSREDGIGVRADVASRELILGATDVAVRQIAHETLRSLEPAYRKKPSYPKGSVMMGGVSITFQPFAPGEAPLPSKTTSAPSAPAPSGGSNEIPIGCIEIDPKLLLRNPSPTQKVGRNDPCPCGSGKKAKKCHTEFT